MGKVNHGLLHVFSVFEIMVIITTVSCMYTAVMRSMPNAPVKTAWLVVTVITAPTGLIGIIFIIGSCYCYCYKDKKSNKFEIGSHVILVIAAVTKDIMLIVSLNTIPNELCGEGVVEDLLLAVKIASYFSVVVSFLHHLKFHFPDPCMHMCLNFFYFIFTNGLSISVLVYSYGHSCNT